MSVKIALFITCLADVFSPRSGIAMTRVLRRLGHQVDFPTDQTCCGQPLLNNGFAKDAARAARAMCGVMGGFDAVVTASASCASMIREHYPRLAAEHPDILTEEAARKLVSRTFEFCEFMLGRGGMPAGCRWDGVAAVHRSCHGRALGLTDEAERVLARVEGLRLVGLANSEQCCGFGGTFSVKYPDLSAPMADDKVSALRASGARWLVTGDTGCAMNIQGACRRAGLVIGVRSVPEIIAEGLGLLPKEGGA